MGIEPTSDLSPGRSTVLKTDAPQAVTLIRTKGKTPISGGFSLLLPYRRGELPPDLAAVVAAWADLPEPIRAAVTALVESQSPRKPSQAGGGR